MWAIILLMGRKGKLSGTQLVDLISLSLMVPDHGLDWEACLPENAVGVGHVSHQWFIFERNIDVQE